MISDIYPPAKRPMASAIFFTGGMVGLLAAFMLGSWLMTNYGWRAAFLAAGPPGFALALLTAFVAREPARERAAAVAGERKSGSFDLILNNRPLVWVLAAGSISTFASAGMMQWLPNFFIRSHHLSPSQIGLFFGPVIGGGMIIGMLLGGWLGNRIAARSPSVAGLLWISTGALCSVVPMYMLVFWIPSLSVAMALAAITTAVSVVYTPIATAAWQTLCDPRARGACGGISGFLAMIVGAAICPFIVGAVSDSLKASLGSESLRYALMASMSFCLVGALMFAHAARLVERSQRS